MLKNIQSFQILNYPKWTRFTKVLNAYPLKIHIRYPQVRKKTPVISGKPDRCAAALENSWRAEPLMHL